jgi:glutathione S-transferase
MIVHGSSISPFVRKVLVFAAEKGLTFENKPTGLGPKSDAFMAISPFGKIPAFEDGDYALCDSSAIVHYLDAAHPATPLIPAEAKARGKAVWFDEYADTIVMPAVGPIFWNRALAPRLKMPIDEAAAAKAEAEAVPPVFAYLEKVAPDAGGFLVGDAFSLADIAVCCPLVNGSYAGLTIEPAQYPRAAAYVSSILARPSFAALMAADKAMMGF